MTSTRRQITTSGIFIASLLSAVVVLTEPNAVSGVLPFIKDLYPEQSTATIQTFPTMGAPGGAVGSEKSITNVSVASVMTSMVTLSSVILGPCFGQIFSRLRAQTGPVLLATWVVAAVEA